MNDKIIYIDRATKEEKVELVYCEGILNFFYTNIFGIFLGKLLAKLSFFSVAYGWWQRQSITRRKIVPFITKYYVNASEFEKNLDDYPSFDAFFSRKLKSTARSIATTD